MQIDPVQTPVDSREFLQACRRILGDTYLLRLFRGMSKSHLEEITVRTIQRWTARRPWVAEEAIRENFIEKLERLLSSLML